MHILVVDDEIGILSSLQKTLEREGYEVTTTDNGEEALDVVRNARVDLVLADIMMPKMNGIDMCRAIKSDPDTQSIPVVMVTTKGEPEKVEQAFLAGCDDYLTKPIDKLELLNKVTKYI